MDFAFIGGSMGSVVGEKVARAAEHALRAPMPLVIVSASGGARMQEGTLALMQLAKTCAALDRLAAAGIPYVSVMTDPTTGGVFASYAVLGDVNLAEPEALIRFAGERVTSGTIAVELPPDYQRAEFLLEHGFLDRVVPRDRLRDELVTILGYLREGSPCSSATLPSGSLAARAAGDGREAGFRPFGFLNTKLPNLPVLEAGRRGAAALGAHAAEVIGALPGTGDGSGSGQALRGWRGRIRRIVRLGRIGRIGRIGQIGRQWQRGRLGRRHVGPPARHTRGPRRHGRVPLVAASRRRGAGTGLGARPGGSQRQAAAHAGPRPCDGHRRRGAARRPALR